ncbi:MAG: Asp-tRNA(Asn)/Glu-tRNA(Gln) amidotransferase subunit GatB [bacterium]
MIDKTIRDQYKVTIGIETHVQLKTKTKLFASVGNDAREAPPNTLVSHICFGMPGALPVLNEEALTLATKAAFALGTEPERFSKFDRKHYFYPDLPKGYQITQFDEPIIGKGEITITVDGQQKKIGITRAHMEEDAGKSTHADGDDFSLVDLNRAGTPLLEIVSEPDLHTSAEAKAYARELYLRMRYADVSDANLYYGNMRFDVNVSVSKTDELGTRSETKNLNSFKSVEKAVDYEVNRQIELLEKGQEIVQETRGWDDNKQKTLSQRSKENSEDYRYMPDPDIPPVKLSEDFIENIKKSMPVMPEEWRTRLAALGVDNSAIDTLLEAEVEDERIDYLAFIEEQMSDKDSAKFVANWVINNQIPMYRDNDKLKDLEQSSVKNIILKIYELVKANKLSSTNAKALFGAALAEDKLPDDIESYASQKGLVQESNVGEIEKIVEQVLADNAKAAEDVAAGEMKAIGFLVGQVMKASKGQANPGLAQQIIRKKLDI